MTKRPKLVTIRDESGGSGDRFQLIPAIFSFTLGFTSIVELNFIGKLTLQEILLAGLAGFLLLTNLNAIPRVYRWLFGAIVVWLVIQLMTDLIRAIPFTDSARGCARIIFFGFALMAFLFWFKKDRYKVAAFLIGSGLSPAISFFIFPSEASHLDPWKWNFALATTSICVGFLCLIRGRLSIYLWAIALSCIGMFSAYQNYRSHAAILLGVACLFLANKVYVRLPVLAKIGMVVGGGMSLLLAYVSLASLGALGTDAQAKLNSQFREEKGVLSILARGRIEYRASTEAIKDSPFFGYGSWAQRPEYVDLLWDPEDGSFNAAKFADHIALGIIPSHSYFFGAWVDGGPLPALFWLTIWLTCFYAMISVRVTNGWLPSLAIYLSAFMLWDIVFSPFGSGARVIAAFGIIIVLEAWQSWAPLKYHKWWLK